MEVLDHIYICNLIFLCFCRNAPRFGHLFAKAEELFGRLNAVKDRWLQWVALGSVDLDNLAHQYLLTSDDWDRNFRASKTWSQEIAKLPT
jgi:dynein heavy chain 2